MLTAIKLNNQRTIAARKIREIGPNAQLPHKLTTVQLAITQGMPQTRFATIVRLTQTPGPVCAFVPRSSHMAPAVAPHPSPLPVNGEREL